MSACYCGDGACIMRTHGLADGFHCVRQAAEADRERLRRDVELGRHERELHTAHQQRWLAELNEARAQRDQLRKALVGIVGADGDELKQLEAVIRATTASDADKTVSLNGIHALIATLP